MTNEELYEVTKKAVEENEMAELLQGKGIYQCPPDRFLPAYIPTDFTRVLHQGIYVYYTNTKDKKAVEKLEEAIKELCKGDAVQIWIAYTYHWFLVRTKMDNRIPFKYKDKKVGAVIAAAVISHEDELKKCKEWNGQNNPDGLWEEIRRTNGVMRDKCGYTIIKNI
ncbi:MAG: hypothetical protein NC300_12955 [Bacteroidales bacterium]|nr:hypothetical protein [Clostridium sp.]MCM1205044.1 hypothetical protein [Bacteroidales bacterium]